MKKKIIKLIFIIIIISIICFIFNTSCQAVITIDKTVSNNTNSTNTLYNNSTNTITNYNEIPLNNGSHINTLLGISQVMLVFIPLIIVVIHYIRLCFKVHNARKSTDISEKELKNLIKKRDSFLGIGVLIVVISHVMSGILSVAKTFKPIIYLYPKDNNTKVSVKLCKPANLGSTYPKYSNGWNVVANKDGTLVDDEGRKLYGLYWDGNYKAKIKFDTGFCVKAEDSAKFLEEKLEILGLNYKEAEEFIIFWLPELEKNKYNLIRFKSIEEINEIMPLEITPKPDNLIRIMMDFKGVSKYQEIPKQKLTTPKRDGFTVVEWGGGPVKGKII